MLENTSITNRSILIINDGENKESTLYRIPNNSILNICPGPTLLGKNIALYCNYPENGKDFVRSEYNLLQWYCSKTQRPVVTKNGSKYTHIANVEMYCKINPHLPGSYHYYFKCENKSSEGSGYFCKNPRLQLGSNENCISLQPDAVRCQTVLVKCLGPLNTWESKFRVAKECGYNMIHLTPIQELGDSRSSYSIRDQLKLNSALNADFKDLEKVVSIISNNWKMAFVCDIVLNHTANESQWLNEHPECSYNCQNSPHLRPAALFDFLLMKIGKAVSNSELECFGISSNITNDHTLQLLKKLILEEYLPKLKMWEFYQVDVEALTQEFYHLALNTAVKQNRNTNDLEVLQNLEFKRLASRIDIAKAVDMFYVKSGGDQNEDLYLKKCVNKFKEYILEINRKIYDEVQSHLIHAVDNIFAGLRYERIQEDGPKYEVINEKYSLFPRYFTHISENVETMEEAANIIFSEKGAFIMAHNGWIMNSDPLNDFAKFQGGIGNVYLRRELIAWGDSVKLRYGDNPEDSPYLWSHMRKYVEQTARIFHGVRLDNCHSTPLHVAEYLLDCARKINPNLYVMAELFTNSDEKDNIFVNRLGITSLIREAQSAWDSHEEGRLVYRYGGEPVGSFAKCNDSFNNINNHILTPVVANALFMDLTHDNPSPISKRSVYDLIPSSALVSMACCGTGSNRGYDELVPHHIHVVDEEREYASWSDTLMDTGIISAKKCLNDLHDYLSSNEYTEVYVDQMTEHIVAITRHNHETHESIILVAYTSFQQPNNLWPVASPNIRPLIFEGHFEEILFEIQFNEIIENGNSFVKDNKFINGLTNYKVNIKRNIDIEESDMLENAFSDQNNRNQFNFKNFKPGSVLSIRVSLDENTKDALDKLNNKLMLINSNLDTQLCSIITKINLNHCNQILYKCDKEERDDNKDAGVYVIPRYGPLVYCGLQGFISVLDDVKKNNDLGHPICCNLREGNWMIDYIWQRLEHKDGLSELSVWMKELLELLKCFPRYLVPKYFDTTIRTVYNVITKHSISMMSQFVYDGDIFIKKLAMSSLQFVSVCQSAKLPPFSSLAKIDAGKCPTISAGLPHFATDYMRCWGRDTFISLRGILLLTGRFKEAHEIILGFAACLRHGLIPNLLSGGYNARYNCRDAVWWWLECIKSYTNIVPNGSSILKDLVSRLYPHDDSDSKAVGEVNQSLNEIMQESLQKHFEGLKFRERNAGRQIDEHMTDQGFENEIGVNLETGFIFGGNAWNCGTWMDKMGSSTKACTKGVPATAREGSAVEIIGLSYSVIKWLSQCYENGIYPYEGVTKVTDNGTIIKWTFKEWSSRIKTNFEKFFYISNHEEFVNHLYIYKDTFGASKPWADYQMRCNFPIAMTIAPDLFEAKNAWKALEKVKSTLLGPLGIKTLDPSDWAYRPNYDNSNDSEDSAIAHGFNYHQGPEWLWPVGFYFRARLHFAKKIGCLEETLSEVRVALSKHLIEIERNHWRGLPELTNENATFCKDSCTTQAWSIGTILEALYDIEEFEKN